jgi:hypothetical protein
MRNPGLLLGRNQLGLPPPPPTGRIGQYPAVAFEVDTARIGGWAVHQTDEAEADLQIGSLAIAQPHIL